MNGEKHFVLVVDTDSYAGNFERELCAYCTGQLGDCGVGEEWAELYKNEESYDFEDIVVSAPDEHGCYRPVKLMATARFFNDGMGNVYPTDEMDWEIVKEKYKETVIKELSDYDKDEIKGLLEKGPSRFPAYNSVGVIFDRKPTKEEIELIKRRAQAFFKTKWPEHYRLAFQINREVIKILGFRLIAEQIVETEESIEI